MKILKFERSQSYEIVRELLDAKEKGKDVIYVKESNGTYNRPVYFSGISNIEKDRYTGRKMTLISTNVIRFDSKSSQDFGSAVELDDDWSNQVFEDDFLVIGYRALLQNIFKKIGEKCEVGENPIRTKYFIRD